MPLVKSMALFWAKAVAEAQTVMIPAKIRPHFSIGEYSFFIVRSPVFVALRNLLISSWFRHLSSGAPGIEEMSALISAQVIIGGLDVVAFVMDLRRAKEFSHIVGTYFRMACAGDKFISSGSRT